MYQVDSDDFERCLRDLCISVNRPYSDDLKRVLWEDLRHVRLSEVRERVAVVRRQGKTRFTSADLKPPPEPEPARTTYQKPDPGKASDMFQRIGGVALLRFLYVNTVPDSMVPTLVGRQKEIAAAARNDPDMRGLEYAEVAKELQPIFEEAYRRVFLDCYPAASSSNVGPQTPSAMRNIA